MHKSFSFLYMHILFLPLVCYYNKDYLKECGVDTDDLDSRTLENPLTTDEVAEIAEKCTTDDYVGTHIIMDHGE